MPSRPRRSATRRAQEAIADIAEHSNPGMSTRNRRSDARGAVASVSRGPPSSPSDGKDHLHLNVRVSSNKLRQATSGASRSSATAIGRERFEGGQIIAGKRNRGGKKNYVVDSDSDDEVEEADEDDEMEDPGDEDAEGEADDDMMDVDAEGEDEGPGDEDADGDLDVEVAPPPTITVSKPGGTRGKTAGQPAQLRSSDDELSDLESSDEVEADETMDVTQYGEDDAEGEEDDDMGIGNDTTMGVGDEEDDDMDSDDEEDEEDDDEEGSRLGTPDLNKMTKRQRARFEDGPQDFMKLSDEVQVKKHLTAEEQSVRRLEMARRRRNLSEKRNEEVKMETINKLLKKQPPKTTRKAAQAGNETPQLDVPKANAMFVRWVSSRDGNRVAVPEEILGGPSGKVFVRGGLDSRRMVEEVS